MPSPSYVRSCKSKDLNSFCAKNHFPTFPSPASPFSNILSWKKQAYLPSVSLQINPHPKSAIQTNIKTTSTQKLKHRWGGTGRTKSNPLATMSRHARLPLTLPTSHLKDGQLKSAPSALLSLVDGIIGYKDYYFLHKRVLCTPAFSTSAVASRINDGAYPPGSTEIDDETGHNC